MSPQKYILFVRYLDGTIHCQVTGFHVYEDLSDLPLGGLEIPCVLECFGKAEDVEKLGKLAVLLIL